MSLHFYHRSLKNTIEALISSCDTCQRLKLVGQGHGHIAPREAERMPWRQIAVDLVGPWTLRVGPQEMTSTALTIIDMVTNLVKVVRLNNKSSVHVALQFENMWLACYPLPQYCIYDQGGEFIGWPFQQVLLCHHIAGHPTTAKNPQANSVCERMHQAIGNA
jgi:transposase InsO family protein